MVSAVALLERTPHNSRIHRMVCCCERMDCGNACACVGVYIGVFNVLVPSSSIIFYCNMHNLLSVSHCRFEILWEGDNYKRFSTQAINTISLVDRRSCSLLDEILNKQNESVLLHFHGVDPTP